MNRLALRSLGAVAWVSALSGWACSTTPHYVGAGGSGSAATSGSASSSESASSSSQGGGGGASASSSSSSSGTGGAGGVMCPPACTALDQCHDVGTCDPASGTCSNPAKSNGALCNTGDPCTPGGTCNGGACSGSPITCSGGKVCQGGTCACPAGHLFCAGTQQCRDTASACSDTSCLDCGYDAACNGTVSLDPVSKYNTTCTSSQGVCAAGNAQASNGADQQQYYHGINYACTKLNGTYGWHPRIGSLSIGGPGCLTGYAHCDYFCTASFSNYAAFCDAASDLDANLSDAVPDGCPQLSPVPLNYLCP